MSRSLDIVDDVAGEFSERVIEAYLGRPSEKFSIALSGGETARHCYERLADVAGSQIDWWNVDFYWGDERCVPLDHSDSNYRLGREALLDRVGAANAAYPMRCDEGPDPYQLRISELGRFDVVHLGLGADGHTASLFPDSAALEADPGRLVVTNSDPLEHNPHERMTLTFAGIERARMVIVTVTGEAKHDALRRVFESGDVPAARVQADRVQFLADRRAAGELGRR